MKKTIVYGNGDYAHLVHQAILDQGGLDVVAFTADTAFVKEPTFRGLPLVEFEGVEKVYPPEEFTMLVVIAFWRMRNRETMFNKAKAKGYRLENFIGSGTIISGSVTMGENNIISEGVLLGPFGRLGDNNMIRPKTYIGHHFKIHSHCYIAPGCTVGGGCEIKSLSFLGIGATVRDTIIVERETLIGAGSLVLKHTEPFSRYVGSPARKVGDHAETGIEFVRRD